MTENQDRIRVWNEETNEMMEPATIQEMLSMERNVRLEGGWAEDEEHVPEDYGHLVFMRNTGVHDVTGNEMFDGDLITKSTEPYVYRVAYLPERAQWWAISLSRSEAATQPLVRIQRPAIVGNVFENKELLMKGEIGDE